MRRRCALRAVLPRLPSGLPSVGFSIRRTLRGELLLHELRLLIIIDGRSIVDDAIANGGFPNALKGKETANANAEPNANVISDAAPKSSSFACAKPVANTHSDTFANSNPNSTTNIDTISCTNTYANSKPHKLANQ